MDQETTHPDWSLISQLGGPTKVASLLGWSVQRVQNWKSRGIPASVKLRRPDLFLPSFGHPAPRKKARA